MRRALPFLLALLFLGGHVSARDLPAVYLPVVRVWQDPSPHGAAGRFSEEDATRWSLMTGQGWRPDTPWYFPEGIAYVPNVSCTVRPYHDYTNGRLQIPVATEVLPSEYAGPILFLNEPLFYKEQCLIDSQTAAHLYWQLVDQFPNACISSPNWSHYAVLERTGDIVDYVREIKAHGERDGREWGGFCFWAVHNYYTKNPTEVYRVLKEIMDTVGDGDRPIWVTEFAVNEPGHMHNMLKATWCDSQIVTSWWYAVRSSWDDPINDRAFNLVHPYGGLTPLGESYDAVWELHKRGLLCLN
jgi:hypothetical protein